MIAKTATTKALTIAIICMKKNKTKIITKCVRKCQTSNGNFMYAVDNYKCITTNNNQIKVFIFSHLRVNSICCVPFFVSRLKIKY